MPRPPRCPDCRQPQGEGRGTGLCESCKALRRLLTALLRDDARGRTAEQERAEREAIHRRRSYLIREQ